MEVTMKPGDEASKDGYFTQARFLRGVASQEIERWVGYCPGWTGDMLLRVPEQGCG